MQTMTSGEWGCLGLRESKYNCNCFYPNHKTKDTAKNALKRIADLDDLLMVWKASKTWPPSLSSRCLLDKHQTNVAASQEHFRQAYSPLFAKGRALSAEHHSACDAKFVSSTACKDILSSPQTELPWHVCQLLHLGMRAFTLPSWKTVTSCCISFIYTTSRKTLRYVKISANGQRAVWDPFLKLHIMNTWSERLEGCAT